MGEDENQIGRTIGAYSQWCDDGRFDQLADLFTEDARLEYPGQAAEGRDAIRALLEKVQPAPARGKHLTANSLVDVRGETAMAATDYLFVRPEAGGLTLVATGRYHDLLVRKGGRWRFTERLITILGPPDRGPDE